MPSDADDTSVLTPLDVTAQYAAGALVGREHWAYVVTLT